MAQFKVFAESVQVNGETVLSIVNAFPELMQKDAQKVLEDNNIANPQAGEWYMQKDWLGAFEEISNKFGSNTLFGIGKVIPENAQFPPQINSLEKALGAIDMAYQMNHKDGEIGYYKLKSFDKNQKKAVMECKNPYPCDFDRGIITTMSRKFALAGSFPNVRLDTSLPNRNNGADSSTYIITW